MGVCRSSENPRRLVLIRIEVYYVTYQIGDTEQHDDFGRLFHGDETRNEVPCIDHQMNDCIDDCQKGHIDSHPFGFVPSWVDVEDEERESSDTTDGEQVEEYLDVHYIVSCSPTA